MANNAFDDAAVFTAPPSFMGVPFSRDLARSKAAILGVPFDCGTHAVRIGARLGPNAIREQSALVRPYEPPLQDFNPLERLGLVDCGNARSSSRAISMPPTPSSRRRYRGSLPRAPSR